jgi:hypothetical protein
MSPAPKRKGIRGQMQQELGLTAEAQRGEAA